MDQIVVFIRALAIVLVLIATFMLIEQIAQYNFFSVFGGVSSGAWIREGRLRAQGPFPHSIIAGTFGAAFLPLFWGLWVGGTSADRPFAVLGSVSAIVITAASSSSGPLLTLAGSVFAVSMWRYRRKLSQLKWLAVIVLVMLDIAMKAPVWHLLARVDLVGGSSGWHRYALIDNAISHFSEWALVGVRGTRHWGFMMHDLANQFVFVAVNHGLLSLILFVLLLRSGFRTIGGSMGFAHLNEREAKLWWSWGAVLFAHVVSFFGVSYFGQITSFLYLTLGMIAVLPETQAGGTLADATVARTVGDVP